MYRLKDLKHVYLSERKFHQHSSDVVCGDPGCDVPLELEAAVTRFVANGFVVETKAFQTTMELMAINSIVRCINRFS